MGKVLCFDGNFEDQKTNTSTLLPFGPYCRMKISEGSGAVEQGEEPQLPALSLPLPLLFPISPTIPQK
jgi:hypothetical protein